MAASGKLSLAFREALVAPARAAPAAAESDEDSEPPPAPRRPARPPPALPRRAGPGLWCVFTCFAAAGLLAFAALIAAEGPYLDDLRPRDRRGGPVAAARPMTVRLGLWDEFNLITPLQLTVALSLATGIDEQRVAVTALDSFFFEVTMADDSGWLVDAVNDADGAFLRALNRRAAAFGAKLVVSRHAHEVNASAYAAPRVLAL